MIEKVGKRKYETIEDMQKKIDNYFDYCEKNKKPFTVSGLAFALGLSREQLNVYCKRENFADILKKAKARIEQYLEEKLVSGSCVTGVIFTLKNNFGWADRQDIVIPSGGINIIVKEK